MKVQKITTTEEELEITVATLLSIDEAEKLPDRLREHYNWWWLRSPGDYQGGAAYVYNDGSFYNYGYRVNGSDCCVRPALRINNLESSNLKIGDSFIFGGEEFEIVSDDLAFCKGDIGDHCFREDWQAENANDYEKSDVKKFVDDWFERSKEDANEN